MDQDEGSRTTPQIRKGMALGAQKPNSPMPQFPHLYKYLILNSCEDEIRLLYKSTL